MRCDAMFMPLLLVLMACAAVSAADGIPGVFAGNNTLYVEGTQSTSNSIAVGLDTTGAYVVATVNGQSVAYDADGVTDIQIIGGAGGGDTIGVGPLYLAQSLQVTTVSGHNSVTLDTGLILAGQTTLTTYGDDNTFTAIAPSTATVWPYGGPHNTYSSTSSFTLTDTSSVPYNPSTIPGVLEVDDEIVIIPQRQSGNAISIQAPSSGSGKVQVTENGVTTASFGTFTPTECSYLSGMGGGDTLTVSMPVNLLSVFFGSPATITLGSGAGGSISVFSSGFTITGPSGVRVTLNEFDPGLTPLTENVSGGCTAFVQAEAVAPMLPVAWSGSASGSSAASGAPTPVTPAASSSSSSHCGLGGGSAVLLAVTLLLAGGRRPRRAASPRHGQAVEDAPLRAEPSSTHAADDVAIVPGTRPRGE